MEVTVVLDALLSIGELLAHGADPRPISGDEAAANLVKFFGTILLAVALSYPILAPLFPSRDNPEQPPTEAAAQGGTGFGWVAIGLLLILSMAWWLTRTSIVELNTEEVPMSEHRHTQERGGQIAMWADFHAEVARIESGELRIYLTDAYSRPIAARFFDAQVTPFQPEPSGSPSPAPRASATPTAGSPAIAPGARPTVPALDDSYRFARMPREDKAYRVKVSTPGWTVTLKFEFDSQNGRSSLPIWCGTPGGEG